MCVPKLNDTGWGLHLVRCRGERQPTRNSREKRPRQTNSKYGVRPQGSLVPEGVATSPHPSRSCKSRRFLTPWLAVQIATRRFQRVNACSARRTTRRLLADRYAPHLAVGQTPYGMCHGGLPSLCRLHHPPLLLIYSPLTHAGLHQLVVVSPSCRSIAADRW